MKPDTILGSFNFAVSDPDWIKERAKVIAVVDHLLETPLGSLMRFAGVQGSMKKAESRKAFHDLVATAKSDVFAITQDKKAPRATFLLTITPTALGIDVRVFDAELDARAKTILDDVVAVVAATRKSGAVAGLRFGYVSPIVRAQAGFPYPRPRPPRKHPTIEVGAVLDPIDVTFHGSDHPSASKAALELASAELPHAARRIEQDGLVQVRWVEDFSDPAALERAAAAHEEWFGQFPGTTIAGGYNELGDLAEPMRGLEGKPPLTMYAPSSRTGYVAVVIDEGGHPEDHYWGIARDVAARHALPDGTPVQRVRVVAPVRSLAIAFAGQARQHGIDAVLYPADDGTWWNPDPPGNWAYPPRDSPTSNA
jgi:hypothetical protein